MIDSALRAVACVGILVLSASPASASGPSVAGVVPPDCQAAEAMIRTYLRSSPDQIVLSDTAPEFHRAEQGLRSGWTAVAPSAALLARFAKTPLKSALTCENTRAEVTEAGAKVVDGAATAQLLKPPPSKESPFVHRISRPVIDSDGRHALVLVAISRAGLAGGERLMLLERKGPSWAVTSVKVLSFS